MLAHTSLFADLTVKWWRALSTLIEKQSTISTKKKSHTINLSSCPCRLFYMSQNPGRCRTKIKRVRGLTVELFYTRYMALRCLPQLYFFSDMKIAKIQRFWVLGHVGSVNEDAPVKISFYSARTFTKTEKVKCRKTCIHWLSFLFRPKPANRYRRKWCKLWVTVTEAIGATRIPTDY